MEHDDDYETTRGGGLMAGIMIGAMIGAGVALLFAPGSGEEARRKISKRARSLRDDAMDRFDEASSRTRRDLQRRRRRLRNRMEEGVDSVRERFSDD